MKRIVMGLMVAVFATGLLAGCNTVAGVGKDVQGAGEKVEDSADKHKN